MQIIKGFSFLFPILFVKINQQIQIKRNPDTACYYVGDSLKIDRIIVKATYSTDEYGKDIIYSVPTKYLDFDKTTFDHEEDNRIVSI